MARRGRCLFAISLWQLWESWEREDGRELVGRHELQVFGVCGSPSCLCQPHLGREPPAGWHPALNARFEDARDIREEAGPAKPWGLVQLPWPLLDWRLVCGEGAAAPGPLHPSLSPCSFCADYGGEGNWPLTAPGLAHRHLLPGGQGPRTVPEGPWRFSLSGLWGQLLHCGSMLCSGLRAGPPWAVRQPSVPTRHS